MITEIAIHQVKELEITTSRLPFPAAEYTTVKIKIGAKGVGGGLEWQVITLFCCDTTEQKFEDSEMARNIMAFNGCYVVVEQ